jgi:hypothetical protein
MANYKNTDWNPKKNSNWVITDMRFPNELKVVKEHGITIRVNRNKWKIEDAQGQVRYFNTYNDLYDGMFNVWGDEHIKEFARNTSELKIDEHESETALDRVKFDYTIENDGSIKDLIKKIKEILIKEKII